MKKQEKNPERMTKIKPSENIYKWWRINFPSEKAAREKTDKNNGTISLNALGLKKKTFILLIFQYIT